MNESRITTGISRYGRMRHSMLGATVLSLTMLITLVKNHSFETSLAH